MGTDVFIALVHVRPLSNQRRPTMPTAKCKKWVSRGSRSDNSITTCAYKYTHSAATNPVWSLIRGCDEAAELRIAFA